MNMTFATKLPAVLTFPGTKQSSLSVLRSLKLIKEVLDTQASPEGDDQEDKLQTAIDELDLLIKSVE
jgi:hypothetical protein